MSLSKEEQEKIQVGIYGFKQNLRPKPSDVSVRIKMLEAISNNQVTVRRVIISGITLAIWLLMLGAYLVSNLLRIKYIGIGAIILVIASLLFSYLYVFSDSVSESLFSSGWDLFKSELEIFKSSRGKIKNLTDVGYAGIRSDGKIEYKDGRIGQMFLLDGATSLTDYPAERANREQISQRYQNGRNSHRTTGETMITSSQLQSAKDQLNNLRKDKDRLGETETDKLIEQVINQQEFAIDQFIDGVQSTVVQYLILQDKSESQLRESIDRLNSFVNSFGLYYSVTPLSKEKTENVLKTMYGFE